jgi:hypothetical protein
MTPGIKHFENFSCLFTRQKKSSILLAAEKTKYAAVSSPEYRPKSLQITDLSYYNLVVNMNRLI